ncbi:uncharacterized protein RHOBADRAFT_51171, partial [Rhodotorula graminis WP1]
LSDHGRSNRIRPRQGELSPLPLAIPSPARPNPLSSPQGEHLALLPLHAHHVAPGRRVGCPRSRRCLCPRPAAGPQVADRRRKARRPDRAVGCARPEALGARGGGSGGAGRRGRRV